MSAQNYLAYDSPLLSAFWSMLWLFLWIMWFVLLFRAVLDIFRDDSLGGGAKAGWLVFCVVLPFLGVFVYVLARGRNRGRRESDRTRAQQQAFDSDVRETARGGEGRPSSVDELARLSEIGTRGDITDEEFRGAKELVLSGSGASGASAAGTPTSGR